MEGWYKLPTAAVKNLLCAVLAYLLRTVVNSSIGHMLQMVPAPKHPSGYTGPTDTRKRKSVGTPQRQMVIKRRRHMVSQLQGAKCSAAPVSKVSYQHDGQCCNLTMSKSRKRGAPDADTHNAAGPEAQHVKKRRTTAGKPTDDEDTFYDTFFHVGCEDGEDYHIVVLPE